MDRPTLKIPPRKRQRRTDEEDDDEAEEDFPAQKNKRLLEADNLEHASESNQQLLLNADFGDDESEDDEDFIPGEDDEDDEDDDDGDYEEEQDADLGGEQHAEDEDDHERVEKQSRDDAKDSSAGNGQYASPSALFRKLHSAFPASPVTVCKNVLKASKGNLDAAYDAMAGGFRPAKSKTAITEPAQERPSIQKSRSKNSEDAVAESETLDREHVEPDESINSLLDYYDQNGLPKGSIDSGTALSHMAEVLEVSTSGTQDRPKGRAANHKIVRFAEDSLSDGLTSTPLLDVDLQIDDSDEDESTSSDLSSSDDESDSAEMSETSSSRSDGDGSNNQGSSDSSSDDDSAPEEASSKTIPEQHKPSPEGPVTSSTLNNQMSVPPREGRKQTKARNARRRNAKALKKLQEKGILPADTTAAEFNKLDIDDHTTKEEALAALDSVRSAHLSQMNRTFMMRRQELLDSLESGGIEVGHESFEAPESPSVASGKPIARKNHEEDILKGTTTDVSAQSVGPTPIEPVDNSTPPSRRARLDLGAGRRLLFGALGIKNPKTKQDEEKLRNNLMKDVRPLINPKPHDSAPAANDDGPDEDLDSWRQSITYRAVECCHDDVHLSEPPFPFVQRWDPQQQGNRLKQGTQDGKRKKDLRDEPQYYTSNQRPSKKQKLRKAKHSYAEEQEYLDSSCEPSYLEDSTAIGYDEAPRVSELPDENAKIMVRSHLQNGLNYAESPGSSQEPADLAPLPDDPSSLPDLQPDQLMTGITIAFKQLIMSETTKWQPQISAYRTAIVIANPGNGELQLTLALRDRRQPEKYYDQETGDRIYGRFDMPVEDDDEEPEDDGTLNLHFSELIEPKIVQNAPDSLVIDAADNAALAVSTTHLDNPSTLNKNKGLEEDQFSHVTETPLNSEVPESYLPAQTIIQPEQESTTQGEAADLSEPERQYSVGKVTAQDEESEQVVARADSTEKFAAVGSTEIVGTPLGKQEDIISDEARQEISLMMKEAGFRSSVPSSLRKDIRPNGMKSPGDAAVFEKLMQDMTEIENHFPSSPKFKGFGSSSPIIQSEQHVSPPPGISQQLPSSPVPPQSSWQTIPFDEPSSLPAESQHEEMAQKTSEDDTGESWETIDPSALAKRPAKRKPKRKLHMAQPIQKANQMWEQLSRLTRDKPSVGSSVDNVQDVPGLSTQSEPHPIDGRDSNASVQYPKLSIGSSFTSQISDHGRQLDVVFEDSTALEGDLNKVTTESSSANHNNDMQLLDDLTFDIGRESPALPANVLATEAEGNEISPDLPSSDELFPPLEVVLSQRDIIPEERNRNGDDQEHNAMGEGDDESLRESNSNFSTPKASKTGSRTTRRAASQPNPRTRRSVARSSETPGSQSQRKEFAVPPGSQVMDLTLSSDGEEEQYPLDAYMPPFRRYKVADDDDDDYRDGDDNAEKGGGWVKKKASSQAEPPRRTGTRLRSSSQASSNPRSSRKKTVAKF